MLITLLKRAILVLFVLSYQALPAFSQNKNFSISKASPNWIVKIKPSGETKKPKEISDGYYLSLLEDQNHAELHLNYRHIIREIASDAGVQNGSEISVTYDPSFQKLIFHKIIVWRNNQPLDRLNASQFKVLANEKDLSKFIYSGTYDAYTILDDIRKGDKIEYAYTVKGDNPIFGNKYSATFYFEGSSTISYWYSNLITDSKRQLNFKNFNFNKPPKTSTTNGLKLYEWENKMTGTHHDAPYEPDWYNTYKHTQISEYQNWAEVVAWGIKTNSYPNLQTPGIDQKVKELLAQAKNDQKKYIELAIRFVQDEIRYMGIEIGIYSQRPNSPEKIFKQRYGDCKDKSLLLVYLLNKVNINAYMAYADTYYGKKINDFLPSPLVFNHAVVVVEFNNVKTWIDPTISFQRGSFESIYFPDYGKALVLKPGNNRLEDVISIPTGKLIADLTFVVGDTSSKAKTTLIVKSTYTDNYADRVRAEIADAGIESTEKSYLEYIIKYYPDAETERKIQVKDDEAANSLEIIESYTINNFWLKEEKSPFRKYVYFYGDLIQDKIITIKLKGRTAPLNLKYPTNIEQNVLIRLPFRPDAANEHQTIETEDYYFDYTSFHKGNDIKLNYAYRTMNDHVATDNLARYVKDTKKIDDLLSYTVSFENTGMPSTSNPYTIIIGIVAFVIAGIYFLRIYQQTGNINLQVMANAKQIGGWLIVLAISLTLGPLTSLINFSQSPLFRITNWNATLGQGWAYICLLKTGIIVQTIVSTAQVAANFLVLLLFYNRRTEFPRIGRLFFLFNILIVISNIMFNLGLSALSSSPADQAIIMSTIGKIIGQSIYSILAAIAWTLYLHNSVRVKQTFVFTYPRSSYEWNLLQYKNQQLASYYKNLGNDTQTNSNNDYLSGINENKTSHNEKL